VRFRNVEHVKVNVGIFMTGKTNKTHLPGLLSSYDRLHSTAFVEDAIGIVITKDLVML
jgi:hypothetical protein